MQEKPIIKKATVVSFERRADRKIWYIIQVIPTCRQCPYFVARRYEDFMYLAAYLDTPKIKYLSSLLVSPRKRLKELNRFLQSLFRQPAAVTNMSPVLEFFAASPVVMDDGRPPIHISSPPPPPPEEQDDDEQQKHRELLLYPAPSPSSLLSPPSAVPTPTSSTNSFTSLFALWKPSRKSSSSSLSSLCSQVAKVFPSLSTPPCAFPRRGSRTSTTTVENVASSNNNNSNVASASSSCGTTGRDSVVDCILKCKIVYDLENIIIIQLARHKSTTTLEQLKERIVQKFDGQVPALDKSSAFDLVYDDARSSSASSILCQPVTDRAVIISQGAHFEHLMNNKWAHVNKITLRCVPAGQESSKKEMSGV